MLLFFQVIFGIYLIIGFCFGVYDVFKNFYLEAIEGWWIVPVRFCRMAFFWPILLDEIFE